MLHDKRNQIIIVLSWLLLVLSIVYFNRPTEGIAKRNALLMVEFQRIHIPPKTLIKKFGASKVHIFVSADFVTQLNCDDISKYYDLAMHNNGWHFIEEKKFKDIDKLDSGIRERCYKRDPYYAYVDWSGSHDNNRPIEWLYSLSMTKQ